MDFKAILNPETAQKHIIEPIAFIGKGYKQPLTLFLFTLLKKKLFLLLCVTKVPVCLF